MKTRRTIIVHPVVVGEQGLSHCNAGRLTVKVNCARYSHGRHRMMRGNICNHLESGLIKTLSKSDQIAKCGWDAAAR